MKTKRLLFSMLRILVSLTLISLLFYMRRDSLRQAIDAIRNLESALFITSCVVFICSISILAARLKVLLYAQGLSVRYSEGLYLTFIGFFFNNFLPTAIGGDVVKAYYAYKKTGAKLKSFISVFMDRFIGVLSLFVLAGISLIFGHSYLKEKMLIWLIASILTVLLFLFTFFLNERLASRLFPLARFMRIFNLYHKAREVYKVINSFKDKKKQIFQAISFSIIAQITGFCIIYFLTKGLGVAIPLKMVLLFMPLVSIICMLPSINGLGIRESAIYFLFGPYVGYENAFVLSLLWLFMLLLVGFIGGISYLLKRERTAQ